MVQANTSGGSNARGERTRRLLVEAGLRLFAARPPDAIAIDEIVAEAGVAKGSFFNHFADRRAFSEAVGAEVRVDLEARVDAANAGIDDPVERLAAGMRVAALYALTERDRAQVLVRGLAGATARANPLNAGLRRDIEAAHAQGTLRAEAEEAGLLFWLGACQALMANIVERGMSKPRAARRMRDVMTMALAGLGLDDRRARKVARSNEAMFLA